MVAARLIADRVRDLAHRKTQAEIAADAGFTNANMMSLLKPEKNKVPVNPVPSSLNKAPETGPAIVMHLAFDQTAGATAATFPLPVV